MEQAAAFHSWDEYAVGLVCGAAYWAFRMGGDQGAEDAAAYLDLNLRLVEQLLGSKQAWAGRMWRRPQGKAYKLSPPEMRALLRNWEGPDGCLATDHITVLGKKVGYCYREKPDQDYPDSGWRFFSGEETDEYANDVNNVGVYSLNTICNYDPDILPLLTAPYGTAYARGGREVPRRALGSAGALILQGRLSAARPRFLSYTTGGWYPPLHTHMIFRHNHNLRYRKDDLP